MFELSPKIIQAERYNWTLVGLDIHVADKFLQWIISSKKI